MIVKSVCNKGFIWNPSNCEYECYKSCDFSEYLDYKNCKCKNKRLLNILAERSSAEEYTENIEETRLVETNSTECNSVESKCKYNFCALYSVLFSILFTINVGIGTYFFYFHWFLKKVLFVLSLVPAFKQQLNELLNWKIQTNRDQKLNLLFLQWHDQSQTFLIKLVKNQQKALQKYWYLLHWIHHNLKDWWLLKYLPCKSFAFDY